MFQKFIAILHARNLEFIRDRSAFGWNVAFPVLVVFGFAFAFSGSTKDIFKVGVLNGKGSELSFLKTKYIDFIPVTDKERAGSGVRARDV